MGTEPDDIAALGEWAPLDKIGAALGKSLAAIRANVLRASRPPARRGRLYRVEDVIAAHAEAAARRATASSTPLTQLRAEKVQLECEMLRHKLRQQRGELLSKIEHEQRMMELVALLIEAFAAAERAVEMVTSDKVVLDAVRSALDHTRADLAKRYEEMTAKHERRRSRGTKTAKA